MEDCPLYRQIPDMRRAVLQESDENQFLAIISEKLTSGYPSFSDYAAWWKLFQFLHPEKDERCTGLFQSFFSNARNILNSSNQETAQFVIDILPIAVTYVDDPQIYAQYFQFAIQLLQSWDLGSHGLRILVKFAEHELLQPILLNYWELRGLIRQILPSHVGLKTHENASLTFDLIYFFSRKGVIEAADIGNSLITVTSTRPPEQLSLKLVGNLLAKVDLEFSRNVLHSVSGRLDEKSLGILTAVAARREELRPD
jgi:hypothetical protein